MSAVCLFITISLVLAVQVTSFTSVQLSNEEREWGYRNTDGVLPPSKWSSKFPICGQDKQSPIDLHTRKCVKRRKKKSLILSGMGCDKVTFEKHGSDLVWTMTANHTCQAKTSHGHSYKLAQFHMHTPSEHTLNGKRYDGEIHFVHTLNDQYLVAGLFLEASLSSPNAFVEKALAPLRHQKGEATKLWEILSPYSLFGKTTKWFNYAGSLTSPPCYERVNWWVAKKPLLVSREQLRFIVKNHRMLHFTKNGRNARPIQALNGRKIKCYKARF